MLVTLFSGFALAGGHKHDIVDTAIKAGSFNTLVAAVQAAELVETLKSKGPFTVFAPTDEAFSQLDKATLESLLKPENKDQLVAILTYHVVAGKVMSTDITGNMEPATVNGSTINIKLSNGKVMINDATVITADVDTDNGVIHVIDKVLIP
ncbi:MAG: fasciclin domain-containing protein [Candidatus Puniceispirillales bacterium]|tara:strand:- start:1648 stop:2100 length:453 start_codon:yes stop_codon:yes gene_type:complete